MKKIIFVSVFAALLWSCVKKEDYDTDKFMKTTWNPEVGFPLLNSVMGVKNLMGNTDSNAVTSAADGLVVLRYQSTAQLIKASDFITFPGNVFLKSPASIPLNIPGTFPVSIPFDASLGVVFSEIEIESGRLELSFDVDANKFSQASFNFQGIKKPDGSNLKMDVSIEPNRVETSDLANHKLVMNSQGEFVFNITIPSGLSGFANPVFQFKDLVYKRIDGDFASKKLLVPVDSLPLHIFKNLNSEGELHVEDPRIILDVKNGFGVPFALDLGSLEGYNTVSGISTKVLKSGQEIFNVGSGTSSTPKNTVVKIDKSNSDLNKVLQPTPMFIKYGIIAGANPGSSGANSNSIENDAELNVSTILELPLSGRIKGLGIVDTVPFSVNESFNLLKQMTISTAIKNGFPFTIKLSMLLLDENYNPVVTDAGNKVYVLKDREIATSGVVNSSTGKIDQNNLETKTNNYVIGDEETQKLLEGKYVKIVGGIETFNNGSDVVGIFDDYIFDLRVGVKITGNITIN